MSSLIETIRKLIMMIEMTDENEVDCSVVYDVMDEIAEKVVDGADLAKLMPEIDQHLKRCAACRAEFEVLQRIVSSPPAVVEDT